MIFSLINSELEFHVRDDDALGKRILHGPVVDLERQIPQFGGILHPDDIGGFLKRDIDVVPGTRLWSPA